MPVLDLVDDTYLAVAPAAVAAAVHDPARWAAWWPGLRLTVTRDRGLRGLQWVATPAPGLARRSWRGRPVRWTGSVELWLEPVGAGTVVHHYQRLDPEDRALTAAQVARLRSARTRSWKRSVHAVKDRLERSSGAPVKDRPGAAEN